MEEVVIKQDARKQFGFLFGGIIFVFLSILIIVSDIKILGTVIIGKVVGIIGAVFFGFCLFFITKRYFNPKDVLIINENGFIDNSTALSVGFVPWSCIKRIYISSAFTEKFISVEINDFENISKEKILGMKLNILFDTSPIAISLNSTNAKYKDILYLMQQYLNNYNTKKYK